MATYSLTIVSKDKNCWNMPPLLLLLLLSTTVENKKKEEEGRRCHTKNLLVLVLFLALSPMNIVYPTVDLLVMLAFLALLLLLLLHVHPIKVIKSWPLAMPGSSYLLWFLLPVALLTLLPYKGRKCNTYLGSNGISMMLGRVMVRPFIRRGHIGYWGKKVRIAAASMMTVMVLILMMPTRAPRAPIVWAMLLLMMMMLRKKKNGVK